jgi:CBS domain-containing protein
MTPKKTGLDRRLAGEQQTLALPLRALLRKEPVVCRETVTGREAVGLMHRHGVGSVVVAGEDRRPVGIFTHHDLANAVERGLESRPIAELMTPARYMLPSHAFAYEAAITMVRNRIRHVLVVDEGRLVGVISERDLFSLQRLGLGEITTQLRLADGIETLADIAAEIRKLTRLLVEQGVAAGHLTLYVSVLNDRLCERVIEVVRKRHQWEHLSWCWLGFGSEGRLEQTFSSDQDNGIIFEAHDGSAPDAARARLLPFAREVNEALDACGFRWCKGNVMASNPALCLTAEEWREKMGGWFMHWEPEALLEASIYFDFRPLYGEVALAAGLREWVLQNARLYPGFLRQMAENAVRAKPAIGALGRFVTESVPEAPHSIDFKLHGVRPFVDAARIFALAQGLPQTNTVERLQASRAGGRMSDSDVAATVDAFLVIQRIRLRHQASQDALGLEVANRIDPDTLHELDRSILKESFRFAQRLQQRLALDYQL